MKLNSEIAIETAEVELLLTEGSTDEALDKFKDTVHATKNQMSDKFKEFKTILRKYMSILRRLFRIEGKMIYTITVVIELCESVFKSLAHANTK